MRYLLILLALPVLATTTVTIDPPTPQQAIIRVHTDTGGTTCTYRASQGTSIGTLIPDIDPSLYTGANSDARAGSIVTGPNHVFVLGTRTAPTSLTSGHVSRSLQANTVYTVGVACAPDAEVTQTFTTANISTGTQWPISPVFDNTSFGNAQVPTVNWANRSAQYVDPVTGTLLIRASDPADLGFSTGNNGNQFAYAKATGGWTNPNNALSASSGTLATCTSCAPAESIYLAAPISVAASFFTATGGWNKGFSFTDALVQIWGSGTDASSANRRIAICWSTNGQTCATNQINVTLPQTTAAFAGTAPQSWSLRSPWSGVAGTTVTNIVVSAGVATVNFSAAHGLSASGQICVNGIRNQNTTGVGGDGLNGCHTIASTPTSTSLTFASNAGTFTYTDSELMVSPTYPSVPWASWAGNTTPIHSLAGTLTGGTITCASGSCTLTSSGSNSYFNQDWAAGTPIFINGSTANCAANSLCTISSVTDYLHATLNEALNITNASWSSANIGILIVKTSGTGSISLSAGYELALSVTMDGGLDGSSDVCNANPVTVSVDAAGNAATPVQGFICTFPTSVEGFNSSGIKPIYTFIPSTGETRLLSLTYLPAAADYRQWIGWHPTQGNSWYACFTASCTNIYRVDYSGDYRAYTPGFLLGTTEAPVVDHTTFTDIFASSSVASQINACLANHKCDSGINAIFGNTPSPPSTGAAIQNGILVLSGSTGAQNSAGYITYWDITTNPGNLLWAGYSFDKFPVGYAGIHTVYQFGNGQYNESLLQPAIGQVGGSNFTGPWEIAPTMLDKGSGYTSNTAVVPSDGTYCPAGLSAQWQALGALPQASGGLPLCLKFKIPGTPCSTHASVSEHGAFPCPWTSATNTSTLKTIGEGDTIADPQFGFVSFGEYMLVVKVVTNSPTDLDVTVFRYRLAPLANYTCGSGTGAEMTHSNGWSWNMSPYLACGGGGYWTNALDSTRSWTAESQQIGGVHSDFGQGASNYTFASGAGVSYYQGRANLPLPGQIGLVPNATILASPTNGSAQLPDTYMQTYPSKRQNAALAPLSEMNWALDVRSYNPAFGNPAETAETLFGNTVSLVGGKSNTYLVTFPGNQTPDPKHVGFVGWAGYHFLADKSGPGSTIVDSDLWKYCYVFTINECVSGSTVGQLYASVPKAAASNQCIVNAYYVNSVCLSNLYPAAWQTTQVNYAGNDLNGVGFRHLTGAMVAPGRQYNFNNTRTPGFAQWALALGDWIEGQAAVLWWVKLPDFPAFSSIAGLDSFSRGIPISVSGRSGDSVDIQFGSDQNLFCSSRLEICKSSSSASVSSPYLYESEGSSRTSCSSGCTVQVPVTSPLVYYRVRRVNSGVTTLGPLQVIRAQ